MKIQNLLRKSALGFLALLLLSCNFQNLQAAQNPIFLRIGLESHFLEREQIPIHSHVLAVGFFSGSGFLPSGFLTTNTYFQARPNNSAFVRLPYVFVNMILAQEAALAYQAQGGVAALMYHGLWGVYLPAQNMEQAHMLAAAFPGAVAVNPSSQRVSITTNGNLVFVSDNVSENLQLQCATGITSLGIRQYRGIIELARFTGNRLTAVNIVDVEDYLLSVVPVEMFPSWHIEALKAQAVAARTFAVYRIGRFAARGYDLCDTTNSQVYAGVEREQQSTTLAVNATRGIMIFHQGALVETMYFSSSGGITEDSENAWGTALPHLRAVAEIYEPGAREWSRTITLSQLNQHLAAAGVNIGGAVGMRLDKNVNGHVQELTILGNNGNHTIRRDSMRWFFSPPFYSRNFTIVGSTASAASPQITPNLPASGHNFAVRTSIGLVPEINLLGARVVAATGGMAIGQETLVLRSAAGVTNTPATGLANLAPNAPVGQVTSVTSTGYHIHIEGRGWGHGVGMSQHGAQGLALLGFDFRQILQHYYTGVEIR